MALKFTILSLVCFASLTLSASPQVPDYIIFGDDTIVTYHLLLEDYLVQFDSAETSKLFGLTFRDGSSFSCWRGYQAIYKVENDSLFLVGIVNCGQVRNKSIDNVASINKMRHIFGDAVKNNRVYINWYSGDLSFPQNNVILRWDGVFYSIYEREKVVSVYYGQVTDIKDVDNYEDDPKGLDRRDKRKVPGILFKKLKKAKWPGANECDCSAKYLVTIDIFGYVSKVAMLEDAIEEDEGELCMNKIFSELKGMKFDVIKDKGKPISEERGKLENWTD